MSLLNTILAVTSYTVIALAVAFTAPAASDGVVAFLLGVVTFLAAILLHLGYLAFSKRSADQRKLVALRDSVRRATQDITVLKEEMAAAKASLAEGGDAKSADMLAELQVLKGLLGQVLQKSKGAKPEPAGSQVAGRRAKTKAPPSKVKASNGVREPEVVLDEEAIFNITRQALAENRVDLFLQPIVSLPQRKVRYYEIFSRIRDESGGILEPEKFMPFAERAGLVSALDNLLLFRSVQLLRKFKKHNRNAGFFLNISSHTLNDEDFFPQFIDFMRHNEELADELHFEFTQKGAAEHGPEVEQKLEKLARRGFQFSMDKIDDLDFDFPALAARHFKFLKVDADFLLDTFSGEEGANGAAELKRAMRRYDIDLIVGKIEDEQMVISLLEFDIDFGQGYLFGEPRPSRESTGAGKSRK